MTSAIIVQIKNENRYLDEWITYHKNLGVNHIYLIDNNDIDGEDPHNIIDKYNDYITYINDRGTIDKNSQQDNYVKIYNEYNKYYDWFLFIDADEFITLVEDHNINDYLNRNIFKNVDQVQLNWTIYDDNDLIYDDKNIPVLERFTRRMEPDYDKEYPIYNLCKSILKGNLHIDEHRIHNIINFSNPFFTVNNIGIENNQEFGSSPHNEDLAYIKHYMTKSLEEFINKKYNKLDGAHFGTYDFEHGYFSINKHTEEKDNYINQYLNSNNNESIGIFYIATDIYKIFFKKFLDTIKYCFPNREKKLIVISDGLKEYHDTYVNGVYIYVEDFISYPYPFININKFQIVNHYAKKYKIDIIAYFDSETYFLKKDEVFYDILIEKSKNQLVSLTPQYFFDYTFRDFIWGMNIYTLWGELNNFVDYTFFYKDSYDNIDLNYKWIQTSFFMCSKEILDEIDNLLQDLIGYNLRVMGCKLNYSDEFYINYLNLYYPEKFNAGYYSIQTYNEDHFKKYDTIFIFQKYKSYKKKLLKKFGNRNDHFRMIMFNINSDKDINKFFIKNRNKFLLCSCNSYTINNKIFFTDIKLNNTWFDGNHNIILEKSFYSNNFISLWDRENLYIGFINKINDYSNNFDYDKFYYEEYDYIEGYSFEDIKNMKFEDIDMCCFSQKYIKSYINNDLDFEPKIYKQ